MVEGNTYISVYNFIFGRQEQQKSENTGISTIFTINKFHSQATWECAGCVERFCYITSAKSKFFHHNA